MPISLPEIEIDQSTRLAPRWQVVLLNDDDHTYEYVVEMLVKLFQHTVETAFTMACEVDQTGRVVVDTTSKERAELKRDQIHAYGADWRMPSSRGSMSSEIEPAE
ncbi:MAG: ATP-dependent Clp protease adaptor ClpS [Planctomycetes bacterium]|nr:ATP-dependent Clp protease adaptor ClpS [Planctomycetota bacterium]